MLSVQELDGSRVTYTHDAAYQLVGEVRSGAHGFAMTLTFDAVGNRTSKVDSSGTTTYQFNAANELTLMAPPTGAPTTSSYDPNGNLALEVTGSARTTMTWDGENRLTKLEPPTGAVEENVYKADGLRQKHVDGDGTIYFIMDEQNVLIEKNADLASAATYTQLPGIWGGVFSCKRGAGHHFLLADFQGHTRQLADTSGSVTETHYYDAWGREVWPIVGGGLYLRPFGQWGYWRDNASRLYVRARHLKPDLGRWMSRDPEPSQRSYTYSDNRPSHAVDPWGLDPSLWCIEQMLKGCTSCGPRINSMLAATVTKIMRHYQGSSPASRQQKCSRISSLNPLIACGAWDILGLTDHAGGNREWVNNPHYVSKGCTHQGCCKDTVSVAGECHLTFNVNYIAVGVMWRQCGLMWSSLLARIAVFKSCRYFGEEMTGAVAWARAGFDGWPVAPTPTSSLSFVCPDKCETSADNWCNNRPWGYRAICLPPTSGSEVIWQPGNSF